MPEPAPGNVPGKYYITEDCAGCEVCIDIAPDNIGLNEDEGYAVVIKQPETPEEEELMVEAMENCPSEALFDDGPA